MDKNKEIKFGHDARLRIKAGIDKACDAVRPTLGAVGMTAIIEYPGLDPIECDDGVTILRNINLSDRHEHLGVLKLRKAAVRTSQEGGDGTATTTVLTQALVNEAFKEINKDSSNVQEVKQRLEQGLQDAIFRLELLKREVTEDDVERIATISSLDPDIAKLIAEIIKEVGVHGVVSVEKGSKLGYSKEIVRGAKFDRGLISPYFVTNHSNATAELEDVHIILVDRKLSSNEQVLPILQSVGVGKSFLFIADDVDSVALATLAQNSANGVAKIACVKNPYTASRGRDFLFDIAALTGATVISEEMGMKMSEATVAQCGKAERVVVGKETTTIIGGKSNDSLKARIELIENSIQNTTSDYEKQILEERLAVLTGGIGVIRVGAYTDTEYNAKKYKFENAINATQAALQEGILPGGGIALYSVAHTMRDKIFKEALIAPFKQMAKNAGLNKSSKPINTQGNLGIDFKDKEHVNMFDAGIIDPFKVTRLALESAVAIAASLITIETSIIEEGSRTQ